jgi:glutathione S-transferase
MDYSPRAQRVWITAHEIGVNVTLVPTDLNKGEHRDPDYISTKHPFGTIPALEVNDACPLIVATVRLNYYW